MQLKIRRSQRESGVLSKNVIFCLDARADFTPSEQQSITRYKLHNQVIYNSEASKQHLAKAAARNDGSIGGGLKSLASVAMAAMKLNVSIASLQRGQHIECKSLDELIGAEEAIMTACENLRGYLDAAATFDGREILFDFATGGPKVIAHSVTPAPALVAPAVALPRPPLAAEAIAAPMVDGSAEPSSSPLPPGPPAPPTTATHLARELSDTFSSFTSTHYKIFGAVAFALILIFMYRR